MLLIGDIHITTKYADAIIDSIASYVKDNNDEKNIIFLGDYMYMFSYDRAALARLFDLFLSFRKDGKNVYVLAGNHDRIGQQFVYAEGKKIADALPQKDNVIRFITDPEVYEIEGKNMLFFPFSKHIVAPENIGNMVSVWDGELPNVINNLLASKNANERLSGLINATLQQYIDIHPKLTIIHHYYIANTKFPGQQALFDYKDIALSPLFLDNKNIELISGHIHMPFAYKNYLCTGSVRYTSPLEQDHHKFLYQRNTQKNSIKAQQIAINPYVVLAIAPDEKIEKTTIENHKKAIDAKIQENFSGSRAVDLSTIDYPLATTHVTLVSESLGYDDLQKHIEPELLHTVRDRSIKRKTSFSPDLSFTLEVAQKNLQESLIDWKIIVKDFIKSRTGEDFDKYRTLLDELHILS